MGKALELYLKNQEDPEIAFIKNWEKQFINKKLEDIQGNPNVIYADSDVDLDLLPENFQGTTFGPSNWEECFNQIRKDKETLGFKNLGSPEKSFYNSIAWECLKTKGLLMIKTFKERIQPKIRKVLALEKEIKLVNDNGDVITGFADLVCEWEDGSTIVFDFKTSTKNYESTSVLTSPQLSLYIFSLFEEYNTRKAGYIVFNKKVIKNKKKICKNCGFNGTGGRHRTCPETIAGDRCDGEWLEKFSPEIFYQIIIDEIPQQTENIVIENIEHINTQIKSGVFIRNLSSCIKPWGPCSYMNLCYKNDMTGLIKVE